MELMALRIGRINRAEEEAMEVSLPSDVFIYMDEKTLDDLAKNNKERYLRILEEMGELIKKPDFVRFGKEDDSIIFLKTYIKKGEFVNEALKIKQKGEPKKWCFESLLPLSNAEAVLLNNKRPFKRIK